MIYFIFKDDLILSFSFNNYNFLITTQILQKIFITKIFIPNYLTTHNNYIIKNTPSV